MGKEKEYRQRLKYQVCSAKKKTVESQLAAGLREDLGMSEAEAELLSRRMSGWLLSRPDVRGPNQIIVDAQDGRRSFVRNGHRVTRKVKLTPYDPEDLDLELEFGLRTMQLGRILRLIEEASSQDSLLSQRQIGEIANITPTSLRKRLREARERGIWAPVLGLPKSERERGCLHRSSWVMKRYLKGESLAKTREMAAMSKGRFADLLFRCGRAAKMVLEGTFEPHSPEESEWEEIIRASDGERLEAIIGDSPPPGGAEAWPDFRLELAEEFGLSPVKVRAIRDILEELQEKLSPARPDPEVIYWAVSSREPAGKPLEACRLLPVKITLIDPGDGRDEPENRMSGLKFKKILRYATQAKYQGGYLTYADLGYLLGIHTEAIRRLIRQNPQIIVPLRGIECDIGRGITHKRKVIELYLQMYTETEIVSRTGHS